MAKYNFSVNRRNLIKNYPETFQVVNCDSFDEARRIVERAISDRELFETEELQKRPLREPGVSGPRKEITGPASPKNIPSGNNSHG